MSKTLSSFAFATLAALTIIGCSEQSGTAEQPAAPPSIAANAPDNDEGAKRIAADVAFLASDDLQGRATGTAGFDQAADYVAKRMTEIGLQPAGDAGSFFQRVPLLEAVRKQEGASFSVTSDGKTQEFVFQTDYLPGVNFNMPEHRITAPMVFVAQAVYAPELGQDDFAGVSLKGKIAVMFGGAPERFEATQRAYYSSRLEKLKQLSERGAVGVIYLRDPRDEERRPYLNDAPNWAVPSMRLLDQQQKAIDAFPQIIATVNTSLPTTKKILQGAPISPDEIFAQLHAGSLKAFELPGSATLTGTTAIKTTESRNVVAMLPGTDDKLANEYAIFTAHLDHLGVGAAVNGDSIYNGALDNALGVSIMLQAAQIAATSAEKPKRSLLFLALTGEEKGLLGSDYFARQPTVPKSAIVANINMDMPVILTELKDVVTIGTDHSTLQQKVEQAAQDVGFLLSPDPAPEEAVFVRSDQFSFVRQGIPAVYLDGGVQPTMPGVDGKALLDGFLREHYHQPSDDLTQPIHYPTAAKMAALNARVGLLIANDPVRPKWNDGDFFGQKFKQQQ